MDLAQLQALIAELLARLAEAALAEVPDDDLVDIQDQLLEAFAGARAIGGAEALEVARQAAAGVTTARGEVTRREAEAAAAEAAEAERVAAEAAEFEALAAELEPEVVEEVADPAAVEVEGEGGEAADGGDAAGGTPVIEEIDAEAVAAAAAAAAATPPPPAPAAPRQTAPARAASPARTPPARRGASLAAIGAHAQGTPARQVTGERRREPGAVSARVQIVGPNKRGAQPKITNMDAICAAFIEANDYWGRTQNGVEMNIPVLHYEWDAPEGFDLRDIAADAVAVTAAIDAQFMDSEALTAAGGICNPYPVDYSLVTIGEDVRPVAGALPTFQATRGGLQWMPNYTLADITVNAGAGSAVAQYTKQNDIDAVSKPCMTFTCKTPQSAELYALLRCLQFGNWNARFYPEMIEQVTRLSLVAYARYAETLLLQGIGAGSTQVDYNGDGYAGFTVSLLSAIQRATTFYAHRYRVPGFGALRVGLPDWIRGVVREDISKRMATGNDQFDVPDSFIDGLIRQRGGEPWYFIDAENDVQGLYGPQLQGPLRDWPNEVVFYVFAEGTWLRMDAGELDLGIVRDSTLNSANNFRTFFEAWEGLMYRGFESMRVNATICANGASAGTYPPEPCAS